MPSLVANNCTEAAMDAPSGSNSEQQFYVTKFGDTELCVPTRYQNLKQIGRGAQGIVVSAEDTVTREPVAIKKLLSPFQNLLFATRAFRELHLMRLVHHKNIISIKNAFTPQKTFDEFTDFYIVMELCDASLQRVIRMDLGHDRLSFLLYQMLCGVRHLHLAGIIHRDLKPTNIVVTKSCALKILDFGLARKRNNQFQSQYVETRFYRAPEIILGMHYDEKADIWSLGCIFGELILGNIMFCGTDSINQWTKIVEKFGTPTDEGFLGRLAPYIRNYVEHLQLILGEIMFHGKEDSIDQWKKIVEKLGSPQDEAFLARLEPKVRVFVEHVATVLQREHGFSPQSLEQLIPDDAFPPVWESEDKQLRLTPSLARDLLGRMLTMDPDKRISIDEALKHPYVKLWFDDKEVNAAPPDPYNDIEDEQNKSVEEWKRFTWDELQQYGTSRHNGGAVSNCHEAMET